MKKGRMRSCNRKFWTGILVLLCMGMLFAPAVQAAGQPKKAEAAGKAKLSETSLLLGKGATVQLELRGAEGKKIVWKSSKNRVATVDSTGLVMAKGTGVCMVTARANGETYRCSVAVYRHHRERMLRKAYEVDTNQNKILVAGSSSIARWDTVSEAFDPRQVVNMGISGSKTNEWLKWYKRYIIAYNPRAVVLYPGAGNQLNHGYSVKRTAADVCSLLKNLHEALPGVPIFYVSIYRNIKNADIWPQEKRCNEIVGEFCDTLKGVYYIDVSKELADGNRPKDGVISDDGAHMSSEGYRIWNRTIVPFVKDAIKKADLKK